MLLRLIVGEFFLGMAAAVIVKCWAPRRVSGWWVVLALAVWLVFARAEMIGAIEPYTWWAIPGFVLLLAGGLYDQATTRTYDRALVLIGEASYVIYLLHYGMIVLFARTVNACRLASRQPEVTLTLLAVVIVLAGVAIHLDRSSGRCCGWRDGICGVRTCRGWPLGRADAAASSRSSSGVSGDVNTTVWRRASGRRVQAWDLLDRGPAPWSAPPWRRLCSLPRMRVDVHGQERPQSDEIGSAVRAEDVGKSYRQGESRVPALHGVSLEVERRSSSPSSGTSREIDLAAPIGRPGRSRKLSGRSPSPGRRSRPCRMTS